MAASNFLANTDEDHAIKKGLMLSLEKREKSIIALGMVNSKETAANKKEMAAKSSPEYISWTEQYRAAVVAYETVNNQRKTQVIVIDVWRSFNKGMTKGNVT